MGYLCAVVDPGRDAGSGASCSCDQTEARREIERLTQELSRAQFRERALESSSYETLVRVDRETQRLALRVESLSDQCRRLAEARDRVRAENDVLRRRSRALASQRDQLVYERDHFAREARVLLSELEAIKRSRSWKITAPLRRAGSMFRAVTAQFKASG